MKRIIIADVKSYNDKGQSRGHYFSVAQNYLDLYEKSYCIKIAGGPIFKTKFKNKCIELPYDFISEGNIIINKWKHLMNCKYLFNNTSTEDVIIMQHSGIVTSLLGIVLFAKKRNSIFIIQYDIEALSSTLKKIIYHIAKNKIKGVICPTLQIANAYKLPYCIVTDYIYPNENYTSSTNYEDKIYDIAIVGSIHPDKGVIEAAKSLSNTNLKVIIAGKGDKSLTDKLEQICLACPNIELHLDYIDNESYFKYIRNSRFCVLNYSGVYANRSSGVVLDIIFNGTPIIGHHCKALEFIESDNIGYLYNHINSIDWESIINKDRFNLYSTNIKKFLDKQKVFKSRILNFIKL